MKILAIDPGPTDSAYVIINDEDMKPVYLMKRPNEEVRDVIRNYKYDWLVVEEVIARKWAGREV